MGPDEWNMDVLIANANEVHTERADLIRRWKLSRHYWRRHLDQAALINPSWVNAVTPSSRPISSAILPSITFSTVVPVKCILRPVAAGRLPTRKSLKAGPVWVPPPSHWPTTWSPSAIRSAVPQKLRSGNAARKSVMNALMSSRPRRRACSEYFRSMSGAPISSTTARFTLLPQNSVNQRPTMALLSSCLLMKMDPLCSEDHRSRSLILSANDYALRARATPRFLPWNWRDARRGNRGLTRPPAPDAARKRPPARRRPSLRRRVRRECRRTDHGALW